MKKPVFADLADLEEDKRIEIIAAAVRSGKKVAFVTDSDPGKADRYIAKLKAKCPEIVIHGKHPGPVRDTVMVTAGPGNLHSQN